MRLIFSAVLMLPIEIKSKEIKKSNYLKDRCKYHQSNLKLINKIINPLLDRKARRSNVSRDVRYKKYKITLKQKCLKLFRNTESTLIHELLHIYNGDIDFYTDTEINMIEHPKINIKNFVFLIKHMIKNMKYDIKVNKQLRLYLAGENFV